MPTAWSRTCSFLRALLAWGMLALLLLSAGMQSVHQGGHAAQWLGADEARQGDALALAKGASVAGDQGSSGSSRFEERGCSLCQSQRTASGLGALCPDFSFLKEPRRVQFAPDSHRWRAFSLGAFSPRAPPSCLS